MKLPTSLRFLFLLVIASALGLGAHVWIKDWTGPQIAMLTVGFAPAVTGGYSNAVLVSSFLTAFTSVGTMMFLYYHAGHLLIVRSRIVKTLIVAAVLLELKGELFRKPVMNYIYNYSIDYPKPLQFALLTQADIWVANLLVAMCLVYLCPTRKT